MSSTEFTYWQEFMRVEVIGAGSNVERWAYMMSALHNGPLTKKSKALFKPEEFMPRRWDPAPTAAKRRPATGADARNFLTRFKK